MKKSKLEKSFAEDTFGFTAKREIKYSNKNPKPKTSPEPIYQEWESLLTQALSSKLKSYIPPPSLPQKMARVNTLKKIHQSMPHPEDLDIIIRYYCNHDILDKEGQHLLIQSPKQLSSPHIMSWILSSMARNGCMNVHLLTPEKEQEYNQKADATPPLWDTYYTDEEKGIQIYREYGILWVKIGISSKGYPVADECLFNDKPEVCFNDPEKGVSVSVFRRMITVRQKGETRIADMRLYKKIYQYEK